MGLISLLFQSFLSREPVAALVMLAVLAARLLLKKAPKQLTVLLWAVVCVRLLLPVSLQAPMSLVPRTVQDAGEFLQSAVADFDSSKAVTSAAQESSAVTQSFSPAASFASNAAPSSLDIAAAIWALGAIALFILQLGKLLRLRRALSGSKCLAENVYASGAIKSAFVLGLFSPRIYLPATLPGKQRELVLLHEKTHIRRLDHVWKWLGFLCLCIHWFDPLVWLCYGLFCRDVELACDEAVSKHLSQTERCDYAQTLLTLSTATPLSPLPSFSQPEPEGRIRRILSWKRPKAIFCALALIFVAGLSVGLLVDRAQADDIFSKRYQVKEQLYDAPMFSFSYTDDTLPNYAVSSSRMLYERQVGASFHERGGLQKTVSLTGATLLSLFETDFLTDEVTQLLLRVKDGWLCKAETARETGEFYLLMPAGRELLLAVGYGYETDHTFVRFLFALEEDSRRFAPEELTDMIKESCGLSAHENIQIYSYYESDTMPDLLFVAFDGAKDGWAVFTRDSAISGFRLKGSTSWDGFQPLFSETASWYDEAVSYTVVLSHREDLALVTASLGEVTQQAPVTACPAMVIFEWDTLEADAHPELHFYNAASEELSRD